MNGRVLYILRHGQTEWNAARRMQGRRDSPLTALGRVQAELHGRTLARQDPVEALIASPLGRTRDTAELVNEHLAAPVRFEDALMERDCGAWSGLTLSEIQAAYPGEWQARSVDPYHHRPPDGENLVDMEARIAVLLDALVNGSERTLALITHGVMSRVIVKRLLALSPAEAVTVRHPNELFYRVEIAPSGQTSSAYYLEGQGPKPGLLRENDSETIAGPARRRE
ncbi:MAG: histidine phosphatase family protein [Gammaproteobacteria bacterium]|nr:histidine phosphatase family protein [Gammaproteobacteria bacterium]